MLIIQHIHISFTLAYHTTMHNNNYSSAIFAYILNRLSAALRCLLLALPILLAASCSDNPRGAEAMAQAQQVIKANPDSALAILSGVSSEADGFPNSQRMAYYLLLADAKNKAYADMSADSIMHEVADYYDTWGDSNEKMRANYLLGCVYRDRGDSPTALRYYNDAVHCADTTSKDCDYAILASLYGQISALYHDLHLYEKDLEFERKAVKASLMAGDTIKAIKYYEHLAPIYDMQNQYDSVVAIAQKASELYKKHIGKDISSQSKILLIGNLIMNKKYAKVKIIMDEYEKESGLFDSTGNIKKSREVYYMFKADYYIGIGRLDSARIYAGKLLKRKDNKKHLLRGYNCMSRILEKEKNYPEALKYAEKYNLLNDSTHNLVVADNFSRMQALYNYNYHERNAIIKTIEARYNKIIYILALCIGAIVLTLTIIFYRKKFKNIEKIKEEERKETTNKYISAIVELNKLKKDQEAYIKQKTDEVIMLRNRLSALNESKENLHFDNFQETLYSELLKSLNDKIKSLSKLSGDDLAMLDYKIKHIFPSFYIYINNPEYGLTQQEKNVCMLIKLHLFSSDIIILLDISKQRASNIRAIINNKLFNTKTSFGVEKSIYKL